MLFIQPIDELNVNVLGSMLNKEASALLGWPSGIDESALKLMSDAGKRIDKALLPLSIIELQKFCGLKAFHQL